MMINPDRLAGMAPDEIARASDRFLAAIVAEGMSDAAMPNLSRMLAEMSRKAAEWRPPADNVVHVNFRRQPAWKPAV